MTFTVRWQLLDSTGSPVGVLRSSGGKVRWDGRATIQRTATGVKFDRNEWQDVNPFRDRLRLLWVDRSGDTTPLGVFSVAQVPQWYTDPTVASDPEPYLVDGGFFLDQPAVEGFSGRLGERLSDVMARIADQAGITDRVIAPCGEFCGEPIMAAPGARYSDSLTGITELANFLPPHFDRNGTLQLIPPAPLTAPPTVRYHTSDVVRRSRVEDDNLLDAPNVFLVIGTGASRTPIVGEAEVPTSAPHSVMNRGRRRVVSVSRQQGIDSQAQADRMARQLAIRQATDYESVTFETLPSPVHDCYDIVEFDGVRYRQRSWTLPLTPDFFQMKHQLDRADREGTT